MRTGYLALAGAALALLCTTSPELARADYEVKRTVQGEPVVVYRARGEPCGSVPSFDWVMNEAFDPDGSKRPAHGELRDGGGDGMTLSKNCGGMVPARLIEYVPDPDFVGEETIIFWGQDKRTVVVSPAPSATATSE